MFLLFRSNILKLLLKVSIPFLINFNNAHADEGIVNMISQNIRINNQVNFLQAKPNKHLYMNRALSGIYHFQIFPGA